ncbi:hypothetical protein QP400_00425 [Winkia sp. UMB3158]|uniref:Uncharacterized protein n=15 Tax=Bacteria TaxID=2 RepID=A0AAW6XRT3_STRAG|nr:MULTISPECIES: hypothetical protein [Terrabacteria group]MDK8341213.1 hypothetical protein [Winkia sp. UMB3164B]MDK8753944.1 hypothetical protein [Actinomycetaceae bacterium UMB8039A]OFT55537.1 hypothetical protein HMPREF3152_04535 [Actinomyces sp. HMSC06A08]MDK6240167.1 hypothetical protein [Winkia sp. UMB10116]MDK6300900.1 hypothetical protein [Streptococcus agalactiae]
MAENDVKNAKLGMSYEYGLDVDLAYPEETPNWQPLRFATKIAPDADPNEKDAATYDDLGADHPINVGDKWSVDLEVRQYRLPDGSYLPEIEKFRNAAMPGKRGKEATVHVRYYDKPAGGPGNPTEAYEGLVTVKFNRGADGVADIGGHSIKCKGLGPRTPIKNPWDGKKLNTPATPTVTPSGPESH